MWWRGRRQSDRRKPTPPEGGASSVDDFGLGDQLLPADPLLWHLAWSFVRRAFNFDSRF
jgi:hypothetical protein